MLGSFMILLVAAIIGVTYYAVIISTYGPQLLRGGSDAIVAFFIVLVFHILLVMLIWCYFMVVTSDPGSVPQNWRPITDEEAAEAQTMPMSASLPSMSNTTCPQPLVGGTGQIPGLRYCAKCENIKPPRSHHCRVCQRCILKMDHHCVWVVNCVGARNYKFFLLFLLYTFLATTLDTFVLLPCFISFFKGFQNRTGSPSGLATTFLAFILNVAFALSLLGFLIMHASLVSSNTTTIEVYEKKKTSRWRYDMGRKKNFEQVFGKQKLYWLFPLYAEEDLETLPVLNGLDFPVRPDVDG